MSLHILIQNEYLRIIEVLLRYYRNNISMLRIMKRLVHHVDGGIIRILMEVFLLLITCVEAR